MTTSEATSPQSGHPSAGHSGDRRIGAWPAILIGIVAVALTLTCGELIAAFAGWLGALDPTAAPFGALGAAFIAITPEWLKDVGIGLFGQSDKAALAVSMVVTFLLAGVLIGLIGRINAHAAAVVGLALLVVTGIAVLSRPDAGISDLVPTALGGVAGIGYLLHVLRPKRDPYAEIHATRGADAKAADERAGAADERAGAADGRAGAIGARTAARGIDRRSMLEATGIGAVVAVVAGGLSRLVPPVADVQADRAGIRLPPAAAPQAGGTPAGPTTIGGGGGGADPAGITGMPQLPANVNPAVPGLTPYLTPATSFYRVDTAFTLPRVTTEGWKLRIHGLVDHPYEISWPELLAMPQVERFITLTCVSNEVGGDLAGNAAWQGVRIADLLIRASPQAGADCVYSTSADNFTVTTPLDVLTDGRDALLAIGMNGAPLPIAHGFPVRMVVPGLYGYVSATKWVVDMEVTSFADVTAYWTERGWAPRGPIKTSSRIDTPGYDVTVPSGVVPVAGVAWAQHRGISAVQVQVDEGPWRPATLAGTASKDTWLQWVFRWDTAGVAPGKHTLRCRAVDATGAVQDGTPAPVAPDGATGYDEVVVVTR